MSIWGNVILIAIASNTLLLVGSGSRKTVAHQALRVGVIQIVDVNHHVQMIQRMKRVHWENATLRVIARNTLRLVDHGPRRIVVDLMVAVVVINIGTVNLHVLR